MTGVFATAARASSCVSMNCKTTIQAGELVYLFKSLERQTVCLECANKRWGYAPSNTPTVTRASERERIGFDSTKSILRKLQLVNANDPKMKQAGDL